MANPGVWGSLGEGENSQAMGREGNWEQDRNRRQENQNLLRGREGGKVLWLE